ncbi:Fibrillin-2, partial [Caligus rogercresseyi]
VHDLWHGLHFNLHTGLCDDNDECAMGMDNCGSLGKGYLCRNIQGSFRCEKRRCDLGRNPLRRRWDLRTLFCQKGFIPGPSGNCLDVDECRENVCFQDRAVRIQWAHITAGMSAHWA